MPAPHDRHLGHVLVIDDFARADDRVVFLDRLKSRLEVALADGKS
jgi:hypothetical protein